MVQLSIVVPTLNEADRLPRLLKDLAALTVPHEIVVADGGSGDATRDVATSLGATVVETEAGRGRQLRFGARSASAGLLCFLHADVRLPATAAERLDRLAREDFRGARAFRLAIDGPGLAYRLIEAGANARSRLWHLPYGDQGLIIDAATYRAAGEFPPVPLMEDVILARRLKRVSPIALLPEHVLVSSRRWERDGPIRRTIRNQLLLLRFLRGASPEMLSRAYHDAGPRHV